MVRPPLPIRATDPAQPVPDVVAPGLRVLFVGINPSLASAAAGHHFARKTNPFWRLLHAAGLTPLPLRPEDERRLLEVGLGITNLCPRATRSAAELTRAEMEDGAVALREKVAALAPRWTALVGLSLYAVLFPAGGERGPGAKRAPLAGSRVYVLPNPSGLNASYPGFAHKLVWFRRLERAAAR